jgi:hypothetical protein
VRLTHVRAIAASGYGDFTARDRDFALKSALDDRQQFLFAVER